jgi:hypothetical protein
MSLFQTFVIRFSFRRTHSVRVLISDEALKARNAGCSRIHTYPLAHINRQVLGKGSHKPATVCAKLSSAADSLEMICSPPEFLNTVFFWPTLG